jgi:hypothetical protein
VEQNHAKCILIGAALVLAGPSLASAQYLNIYGSPTYDQTTQTGYQTNSNLYPAISGVGVAVSTQYKSIGGTDAGPRAVYWDASGFATELGTLGTDGSGHTYVGVGAVNTAGVIVGSAHKYSGGADLGTRAVRWDASGSAMELGNLGTNSSGVTYGGANAVNITGVAAGYAEKFSGDADFGSRAVRWDASGTIATELGGINADAFPYSAVALAINNAGTAVGYSDEHDGSGNHIGSRAVRWDASGTAATELGNLGSDGFTSTHSEASAINSAGTAIGFAVKISGGALFGVRAVRWDASSTAATELGNLGTYNGFTATKVYAINDAGTAVGYSRKYDNFGNYLGLRPVRWNASGTAATELGNLGTDTSGSTISVAEAINAAGTTVGRAEKWNGDTDLGSRAVLWQSNGTAIDLNTLINPASGWTLYDAQSISDTNWVAGWGAFDPDGAGPLASYGRMFLLDLLGPLAGDFNRDRQITSADLPLMLQALADPAGYKMAYHVSDSDFAIIGDLDHSGTVDNADVQAMIFRLQNPGGDVLPSAVPEPGALSLLLPATLATLPLTQPRLLGRRRRSTPRSVEFWC